MRIPLKKPTPRPMPAIVPVQAPTPTVDPRAEPSAAPLHVEASEDMTRVLENGDQIAALEKRIAELKARNSELLHAVLKEHGSSFKFGARYYNIRQRNGSYFYLASDVPFGSWKKKRTDN